MIKKKKFYLRTTNNLEELIQFSIIQIFYMTDAICFYLNLIPTAMNIEFFSSRILIEKISQGGYYCCFNHSFQIRSDTKFKFQILTRLLGFDRVIWSLESICFFKKLNRDYFSKKYKNQQVTTNFLIKLLDSSSHIGILFQSNLIPASSQLPS